MQNAFSGGHIICQEVARDILDAGGNAFDAAIAVHLAMFIAEPCMASAGANGFALIKTAESAISFLDFFAQTPISKKKENLDYQPITVDFGTEKEVFHVGLASVAVPGSIAAIYKIHRRLAKMPMHELVEPAIKLAKEGVALNAFQAHDISLLSSIFSLSERGKALILPKGKVLKEGEILKMPQMADFLYTLAREGRDLFYRGEIARQITKDSLSQGGHLRMEDFDNYRVKMLSPIIYPMGDKRLYLPNGPSKGGAALALFLDHWIHNEDMLSAMKNVLKLIDDPSALMSTINQRIPSIKYELSPSSRAHQGTSHFNIIDKAGNAISFTSSLGEGSGYFIKGTDMQLNNMLGEEFLLPQGAHSWKENTRLHSMMTPLMITSEYGSLEMIAGSGGASRIPFVLAQVIDKLYHKGYTLRDAINASRYFYQYDTIQVELGAEAIKGEHKQKLWNDKSLYFGGVHAISNINGQQESYGDTRRLGVGMVF